MNGATLSYMIVDELAAENGRREVIVIRPDGRTHGLSFPESLDLGQVLEPGERVAVELPTPRGEQPFAWPPRK